MVYPAQVTVSGHIPARFPPRYERLCGTTEKDAQGFLDTPLNDEELEQFLRQSVYEVNNLSDREGEKYARMQVRFNRTQRFLDYLAEEENRDFERFDMYRLPKPLSERFMPGIQDRFRSDREYIERKLQQGLFEDTPFQSDDFSKAQLELLSVEGDFEENNDEGTDKK